MLVCLGLGSNLGDRKKNLQTAIANIIKFPKASKFHRSSIYKSQAIEVETRQNDYLNMVVSFKLPDSFENFVSAKKLWQFLSSIETELGRKRPYYHSPRTIDIDILIYGQLKSTNQLFIPHPGIDQRLFVLMPLLEVFRQYPNSSRPIKGIGNFFDVNEIGAKIINLQKFQICKKLESNYLNSSLE